MFALAAPVNSAGAEVVEMVALPPIEELRGRTPEGADETGMDGAGAVSTVRPPSKDEEVGEARVRVLPTPPRTGEDAEADGTSVAGGASLEGGVPVTVTVAVPQLQGVSSSERSALSLPPAGLLTSPVGTG